MEGSWATIIGKNAEDVHIFQWALDDHIVLKICGGDRLILEAAGQHLGHEIHIEGAKVQVFVAQMR